MPIAMPTQARLTGREYEIAMILVNYGSDNQTIAKALGLSEDTIKSHVKQILRKTELTTRTELVSAVWRGDVDLFSPDDVKAQS
jgi:two-component system vancomycin resistance associated response regulator VraR